MANYTEMTAYELEQELERVTDKMMACNDEAEIEILASNIESIIDELESRDTLTDE